MNYNWSLLCDLNKINNRVLTLNKDNDKLNNILSNNKVLPEKTYDIDDIINNIKSESDINKLNILKILKYELELSNSINKFYNLNNKITKKNILLLLKTILYCTGLLRINLKKNKINHKLQNITINYIPRCSYKFCNFKDNCKYNYSNNKKKCCYADHYVHDLVEADLLVIIYYIENVINDDKFYNNKQICKSFSTINYVIKHMYNELSSLTLYLKKNDKIENFHINNKINKINKPAPKKQRKINIK